MKRLSLEELKAQKNVVAQLEAIQGGNLNNCHGAFTSQPHPVTLPNGTAMPKK